MIYGLSGQIRYYLYAPATDMRKGFDALSGLVRNELFRNPLSGDAFIFINRRRNLLKLLVWDQTGFVIKQISGSLPVQQFDLITSLIDKDENLSSCGIAA